MKAIDGVAMLIVLDCDDGDAATTIAAIVRLAEDLGGVARADAVSGAVTALFVTVPPDAVDRFGSALALRGASSYPRDFSQHNGIAVLVTHRKSSTRSERSPQ